MSIENLDGKIVVLGVGNVLLRDEGVGVRVVQELERRYQFPDQVAVIDGGTLGLSLLAVIHAASRLIVVDAVTNRGRPGTLYRLTADDLPKTVAYKTSIHQTDLVEAINICREVFDHEPPVTIIGVEPEDINPYNVQLSAPVAAAVPDMIEAVLDEIRSQDVGPIVAKDFDPSQPLPLT